jgi:CHASE2 domain-containing sensor protein/signal transduction histidine kinase
MRSFTRSQRLAGEWWLVALVCSALAIFLSYDKSTARADAIVYDLLLRMQDREPDPRILLVAIDNQSLQEFGAWPWPRDLQARLIEAIGAMRPKAVAYDVLVVEPSRTDADVALARAVSAAAPVFLPLLFEVPGANGASSQFSLPIAPVRSGAGGIGHVNLISDPDGLVRRVRLWEDNRRLWPHLMVLMHDAAIGTSPAPPKSETATSPRLIPFAGPAGHFPTIGASAVLKGEVPAEFVRDRLVIVGANADGLGDRHPTRRGDDAGVMAGIEIQANILDGLLANRMITEAGLGARMALALVPLWILLIGYRVLRPRGTHWLLAALAAATLASSAGSLVLLRFWNPPVAALLMLVILHPLWGWRRLASVSASMLRQLEQLRTEPDILAHPVASHGTVDPISRQALLLDDAITRLRDIRRFIGETLSQLPDAIFVLSADGKILLVNDAARDLLLSLGIDESHPPITAMLDHLSSESDSPDMPAAERDLLWPPPADGLRLDCRSRDGRHFAMVMIPRTSAAGAAAGWILRLGDVSEIWNARQQREDLMRFLTHDMRSPQASILAVIATAKPDEISSTVARKIEAYADRTLRLADDFVQLARAEMLTYRLEPVNLSDVLLDAIDDLWPQISARTMTIHTSGENTEWIVLGERQLLTRAVLNLLDNARKYSAPGAVITCQLGAPAEAPGTVRCEIADSGNGITPDMLSRLFERFERGGSHIGERIDGAGLGLAFVHAVVKRHGGSVACTSQVGRGSTFSITLPLQEVPEQV